MRNLTTALYCARRPYKAFSIILEFPWYSFPLKPLVRQAKKAIVSLASALAALFNLNRSSLTYCPKVATTPPSGYSSTVGTGVSIIPFSSMYAMQAWTHCLSRSPASMTRSSKSGSERSLLLISLEKMSLTICRTLAMSRSGMFCSSSSPLRVMYLLSNL